MCYEISMFFYYGLLPWCSILLQKQKPSPTWAKTYNIEPPKYLPLNKLIVSVFYDRDRKPTNTEKMGSSTRPQSSLGLVLGRKQEENVSGAGAEWTHTERKSCAPDLQGGMRKKKAVSKANVAWRGLEVARSFFAHLTLRSGISNCTAGSFQADKALSASPFPLYPGSPFWTLTSGQPKHISQSLISINNGSS